MFDSAGPTAAFFLPQKETIAAKHDTDQVAFRTKRHFSFSDCFPKEGFRFADSACSRCKARNVDRCLDHRFREYIVADRTEENRSSPRSQSEADSRYGFR